MSRTQAQKDPLEEIIKRAEDFLIDTNFAKEKEGNKRPWRAIEIAKGTTKILQNEYPEKQTTMRQTWKTSSNNQTETIVGAWVYPRHCLGYIHQSRVSPNVTNIIETTTFCGLFCIEERDGKTYAKAKTGIEGIIHLKENGDSEISYKFVT